MHGQLSSVQAFPLFSTYRFRCYAVLPHFSLTTLQDILLLQLLVSREPFSRTVQTNERNKPQKRPSSIVLSASLSISSPGCASLSSISGPPLSSTDAAAEAELTESCVLCRVLRRYLTTFWHADFCVS